MRAYAILFTRKIGSYLSFPSWLPLEPLSHCLVHTQCKLVIFDTERAQLIQPAVQKLRQDSEIQAFIVFDDDKNPNNHWPGLLSFDKSLQQYHSDGTDAITPVDIIKPEDNATIIFTSGLLITFVIYIYLVKFLQGQRDSPRVF